jgi:hypothetical protein
MGRCAGQIDRDVVMYWSEHSDLARYTQTHWTQLRTLLAGKLHVYVGDMDQFYRNYEVHLFQDFLKTDGVLARWGDTSIRNYETLEGSRQPMTNAEPVRIMADHVAMGRAKERTHPTATQMIPVWHIALEPAAARADDHHVSCLPSIEANRHT